MYSKSRPQYDYASKNFVQSQHSTFNTVYVTQELRLYCASVFVAGCVCKLSY